MKLLANLFCLHFTQPLEQPLTAAVGLKRDDLIIEEHDVVQEALKRLPKDQLHARYQRFKVALHYSMLRKPLPKEQWIQNEEDYAYLMPYIEQVLAEHEEKEKYDTGLFKRQH